MTKGKYIVIEGAEGVGKTTMVHKLADELRTQGLSVRVMREPDSQNDLTARVIRRLTRDPIYPTTTRTEVLLFNAARSQSLEVIRQATANGVHCLVDRSYLTTLANQYYGRGDIQDYQKINEIIDFAVGDMQPDLMIVLDAPVNVLRERLEHRTNSHGRFGSLDEGFYERVRAGYLWEAKQRGLPVVYANEDIDTVFKNIWQHVAATLTLRSHTDEESKPQSVAEVLAANPPTKVGPAEPPVIEEGKSQRQEREAPAKKQAPKTDTTQQWTRKHENGAKTITEAGEVELRRYVTNTTGAVYGFTEAISPVTVAAAMARLSRRGDDMRVTLLDEFIGKVDKDAQLLHRVITAFGDDSVQQLTGIHMVVEDTTKLMTNILEWGRLAAYLEQSTRYIYFDQKDASGHYRYYIPPELKGKVRGQYIRTMNQIFDLYSKMVIEMTTYVRAHSTTPKKEQDAAWRSATKAQACDAIRPVLPLATKTTVGIFASGQAMESLIMHLQSNELAEARHIGDQILTEARKTMPVFFERADKPDRGGAAIAYRANTFSAVKKLANELLPPNHTTNSEAARLVDYTPRNEIDIVADMLYEHSDMSLPDLQQAVAAWPYDRKLQVFTTYIGERLNRRHRPGRALEKIHYSWDLICDFGIFCDLMRHRMVDDLEWQVVTPRIGYDTPELVEEAGLADQYDQCFDLSLQLHSTLSAGGVSLADAQYAALLGHKMRWKVTYNAREAFHLHELRTTPQGHPGYRKLVQQMHAKIAEVHPLLAEAMRFVNQGEDPELARLAAERYTQYKLEQLDKIKLDA